ncbi:MAG: benzoate-CoA ligase family protein [Acidimicrobiia bacterium]
MTSGSTADRFNIAAWLVDRHLDAGHGARPAIVCGDQTLRYADVAEQVQRAANGLLACGLRREERVLLVMNDEPAFVAFFLAALRLGAVPVPTSTMLTPAEVAVIAADAHVRVAVVSAEYAGHLPAVRAAADGLAATIVADEPGTDIADAADSATYRWSELDDTTAVPVATTSGESPGFWLYTSGTTGTPKGAMHRHADPKVTADTYAASVLQITPEDRCHSVAKLFFAYGLGNSLTFPFAVGAATVLNPQRPTPAGVADLVERHRPTLFFGSPGFYAGLLDAAVPRERFASVRLGASAGEVLPAALHMRVVDHFGFPVLDGIGSTEALHIFLSNRVGAERGGTSGTPVPGYECKLCDDAGNEILEADTPGQLHIRGESIATGYWCRREATQAAFLGPWNRTGDVYTRSADGYWTFLGRNNDMMKVGGIWVSPAEVENVLLQHPDVLEAVVVGARTAGDELETAVAFLVARSGRRIDPDDVEAHCRRHMAAFKRPRRIVVVDALPKTATGKVQRFALRQQLAVPATPPA